MILYSIFYNECIWREKKKQIKQLESTMTTDGGQNYSSNSPFLQNYSWKPFESTIMKIVPNDSKLVFVINMLTVVYCCLLLSYTNRFSTKKKNKIPFFDDVNVSVTGKIVLTLNAH